MGTLNVTLFKCPCLFIILDSAASYAMTARLKLCKKATAGAPCNSLVTILILHLGVESRSGLNNLV